MGKSQIKAGVVLSYLIILVNTLGGFLLTPFLLRELGQDLYGLYTLIASFSGYMMLMDFGVATTSVRYISKYRSENDKNKVEKFIGSILSFYIIVCCIVLIVGIFLYLNLENIFSSSITNELLPSAQIMFVFVIINSSLTMFAHALPAIITAYEKFTFSKILDLIRIILRIYLIIAFVKVGYSSLSIIIVDTILNVSLIFVRWYYIRNSLGINLKLQKFDKCFVQEVGQFSFYVFLSSIVNQVNIRADQIILGVVSTTEEIAISGIASKLNQYYHQIAVAISGVFLPRVTSLVVRKTNALEIEEFAIRIGKLQGKLLLYIIVGFIAVGKDFIKVWAGPGYESAYCIVIVLMCSNLASYTQGILLSVSHAMNKHKIRNIIYAIITIFNIIISIPLANEYGALGASIGTGISMTIGYYILIQVYYHRALNINMKRFFFETIIKPMPSAIITLFIAINLGNNNIISIISRILLITILYFSMLYFTDFSIYERKLLKSFISKIKKTPY